MVERNSKKVPTEVYSRRSSQDNYQGTLNKTKVEWRVVETRARDGVGVEVSELPLKIPRYTFRVGSARFEKDEYGKTICIIQPRLTTFNYMEAVKLLHEVGEKYENKREDAIAEAENLKIDWVSDESGESGNGF